MRASAARAMTNGTRPEQHGQLRLVCVGNGEARYDAQPHVAPSLAQELRCMSSGSVCLVCGHGLVREWEAHGASTAGGPRALGSTAGSVLKCSRCGSELERC